MHQFNSKNNDSVKTLCNELNRYLMRRFDYKTPPACCHLSNTLNASRKPFDLHFRVNQQLDFWGNDVLVIARINFKPQRKGHGTSLLRFLSNASCLCGYTKIGIEHPNANSDKFAERFNFTKFKENHWIIDVENLAKQF